MTSPPLLSCVALNGLQLLQHRFLDLGFNAEVALEIAYTVALKAQEEGLAPAREPEALRGEVIESQWIPEYLPYQA